MSSERTVLLVGGTGRTGQRVLCRLLERGVAVRAVVRSAGRLPPGVAGDPRLTVVEADLLALDDEGLAAQVRGCEAVVSCLGHTISLRGVFGPPHDLVARATARLCGAIRDSRPAAPVKFILMSSVSVDHPGTTDERRTDPERLLLRVLRRLVPPARDNQRRGLPPRRGRDGRPARAVGRRPPGHPPGRGGLGVRAPRAPGEQPLQAGRHPHVERRRFHVRSGDR
ncbi:MAG: SDR family oxidoreductase [bacterium]|nr:SDR family oxidoreductase [bacterium]